MASSAPHPPAVKLDSKLGAAFLGGLVASIFYGVTCVQTYIYFFKSGVRDRAWFRTIIALLWFLDTMHLAIITHGLYFYLVTSFGHLQALLSPAWSLMAQVYFTCISDLLIRCIFARRVWMLASKNKLLAACIGISSLLTFVTGFMFASRALGEHLTFEQFSRISYLLYIALGTGVAADILIAATLCFSLSRSRTGFKKTDSIVNLLMMYAINTSLLTTICSGACFITYAIWPHEFTFIGIYFSLPKLFLNSLLATLNGRELLSEKITGVSDISTSGVSRADYSGKGVPSRHGPSVVVSINREVTEDFELGNISKSKSG